MAQMWAGSGPTLCYCLVCRHVILIMREIQLGEEEVKSRDDEMQESLYFML